jgi:hypothetical protein
MSIVYPSLYKLLEELPTAPEPKTPGIIFPARTSSAWYELRTNGSAMTV